MGAMFCHRGTHTVSTAIADVEFASDVFLPRLPLLQGPAWAVRALPCPLALPWSLPGGPRPGGGCPLPRGEPIFARSPLLPLALPAPALLPVSVQDGLTHLHRKEGGQSPGHTCIPSAPPRSAPSLPQPAKPLLSWLAGWPAQAPPFRASFSSLLLQEPDWESRASCDLPVHLHSWRAALQLSAGALPGSPACHMCSGIPSGLREAWGLVQHGRGGYQGSIATSSALPTSKG